MMNRANSYFRRIETDLFEAKQTVAELQPLYDHLRILFPDPNRKIVDILAEATQPLSTRELAQHFPTKTRRRCTRSSRV